MDISRHDRRRRLTLVLLVITSLALVSLDERGSGIINSARTAAQDVVAPVQDLADDVINPVADWLDGLGRANELQDENDKLRRQLDAARAADRGRQGDAGASWPSSGRSPTSPTSTTAPRSPPRSIGRGPGQLLAHLAPSRRDRRRASRWTCPWSSARAARPRWSAGSRACRRTARSCNASTTRSFGVGAQLIQPDKEGPPGTAEGQRDSNLLRFSVVDNSTTAIVLNKGDVAITLGGDADKNYPRGLVIGTVVHTVDAGGAIARDATLRPVVDLDALTIVKVLKYPPVPIP